MYGLRTMPLLKSDQWFHHEMNRIRTPSAFHSEWTLSVQTTFCFWITVIKNVRRQDRLDSKATAVLCSVYVITF